MSTIFRELDTCMDPWGVQVRNFAASNKGGCACCSNGKSDAASGSLWGKDFPLQALPSVEAWSILHPNTHLPNISDAMIESPPVPHVPCIQLLRGL